MKMVGESSNLQNRTTGASVETAQSRGDTEVHLTNGSGEIQLAALFI